MIGILVLTHGQFGDDLIKTVEAITNDTESVAALNISRRLDFDTLRGRVLEKIQTLNADGGVLLMIDTYGSTSYNTAVPLMEQNRICMVTGVNLPMILSALTNRNRMNLFDLAKKVASDAKKTIQVSSKSEVNCS